MTRAASSSRPTFSRWQQRDARLPEDKRLAAKKGYGAKSVENLFKAIEARRKIAARPLHLCARHPPRRRDHGARSRQGAGHASRPSAPPTIAAATGGKDSEAYQELDNIEGIGETVVDALVDFFSEPHNTAALDDLLAQVTVEPFVRSPRRTSPVAGQDRGVHRHAGEHDPRARPRRWPSGWAPRSRARCRRRPTTWWRAATPAPSSPRRARRASQC